MEVGRITVAGSYINGTRVVLPITLTLMKKIKFLVKILMHNTLHSYIYN